MSTLLRRQFTVFLLIVTLFVAMIGVVKAAAVEPLNIVSYQGRVLNAAGVPVADTTLSITFKLYNVSSGGVALWTETRTVSLSSGLFSENLGDGASIASSVFSDNDSVYLGITIGADSEMTPRKRMTAAPYALNAQTLDGLDSTLFFRTDGSFNGISQLVKLDGTGKLPAIDGSQLTNLPGGGGGTWGSITGSLAAQTDLDSALSGKEPTLSAGTSSQYYRGDKTWQTLNKTAVGLSSVENTALSTWAGTSNITTTGTVTSGTWSGLFGAVSGANLTNLTAANISSGTAGISISGNASTVTTNANLTGVITSVGNATSIASQTGTGSTFVVQTSPSITTSLLTGSVSFDLLNTTATTINFAGDATTLNLAAGGALGRAINIGTGTGVDTINIGTGGSSADLIAIGSSANAWSVTTGGIATLSQVTTKPFVDLYITTAFPTAPATTGSLINITAGSGNTAGGGALILAGGSTDVSGGGVGGEVQITGGAALSFGHTGGDVTIKGGAPGSTGIAGSVNIDGGVTGGLDTEGTINLGSNYGGTVNICNSAKCDNVNIATNADADTISIGDALDTTTIDSLAINLGTSNAARAINIGTGNAIDTINIGTGGTGVDLIAIGSSANAWSIDTTGALAGIASITTDDNQGSLVSNINVTGADVASHTFAFEIDSDPLMLISASGNGLGGITGRQISLGTSSADTINIATDNTSADPIAIGNSNAFTSLSLDSGSSSGVFLNERGAITKTYIGSNSTDGASTVQIATNATTADTIAIGNANGSTTLDLSSGTWSVSTAGLITTASDLAVNGSDITTSSAGAATIFNTNATSLSLGGAATTALNIGNGSGSYTEINLGSGSGTHTINIAGTGAASADTINIGTDSTSGDTLNIGNVNASTTTRMSGRYLYLNNTTGTNEVDIGGTGSNSATDTIYIATNGTAADSIVIGNTNLLTAVTLNGGANGGGLYLNDGGAASTAHTYIGGNNLDQADGIQIATNSTTADTIAIGNSNAATALSLTGGTAWSITSGGALTVVSCSGCGSGGTFANGTVAAPSIAFTSDTSTGMYRVGASDIGFAVGGTKVFSVKSSGYSGIFFKGEASHTIKLDDSTTNNTPGSTLYIYGAAGATNSGAVGAAGGDITISAGTGGSGATSSGTGGNIYMDAGDKNFFQSGNTGLIYIGNQYAKGVTIGNMDAANYGMNPTLTLQGGAYNGTGINSAIVMQDDNLRSGTLLYADLYSTNAVSGTGIDIKYSASTTQDTSSMTQMSLSMANLVGSNSTNQTNLAITTRGETRSGSGTETVSGLTIASSAALTQNTAAGTFTWNGIGITSPAATANFAGSTMSESAFKATLSAITGTIGTATSRGLEVVIPSSAVVTSGTMSGISIGGTSTGNIATGPAAGTLYGLNIANISTPGAGTETAINLGSGWDNQLSGIGWGVTGTGAMTLTEQSTSVSPLTITGIANATSNAIAINSTNINGTLLNIANTSTQSTSAITGMGIDFTNTTGANALDMTNLSLTMNGATRSGVGTENLNGLSIQSSAAISQTGSAGKIYWSGVNMTTPNATVNNAGAGTIVNVAGTRITLGTITQTAGTAIVASGHTVTIPDTAIVTGGTMHGYAVAGASTGVIGTGPAVGTINGFSFPNVTTSTSGGTINALSIGNVTTSGGTDNAITIGTGWDKQINGTGWSVTATGNITGTYASSGTFALCHATNGAQTEAITDCSGSVSADYAEMYPTAAGITYGDIVTPGTGKVVTKDGDTIAQLVKTSSSYQGPVAGIVSNNYGDFTSAGYNVNDVDNPMPVALVGRVPVNVTNENGPIHVGDFVTTSSTPGKGMKATLAGRIIGMALSDFDGADGQVMVQVNNSWYFGSLIGNDGTSTLLTDNVIVAPVGKATSSTTSFDSYGLALRGSAWNGSQAETVSMMFKNVVTDGTNYRLSVHNTADSEVAYITNTGTMQVAGDMVVGGKIYPSNLGGIQKDKYIYYDGSTGPGGDFMRTNASGWSTGSYDFAEMFPSTEALESGDVVIFSETNENVKRSTKVDEKAIAGIVSTRPGFLAGENTPGSFPIALAGRVPTKVNNENGSVAVGDPLTTSSTAGVAMKATKAGPIVGYALEPLSDAQGMIIVYVSAGYWGGEATSSTPGADNRASLFGSSGSSMMTSLSMSGNINMEGNTIANIGRLVGLSDAWSIEHDGTIKTEALLKTVIKGQNNQKVETIAVTSPEAIITLSGSSTLKNGEADVHFMDVNKDFGNVISAVTPIRVVATPNGPVSLYVFEKDQNHFVVKSFGGNATDVEFDWVVTAYRKGFEPVPDPVVPTTPVVTSAVSDGTVPTDLTVPVIVDSSPASPSDVPASSTSSSTTIVDPSVIDVSVTAPTLTP